jgi:NADH-quinone oxidoreductase subunit F
MKEVRIALRNVGKIDPMSIEDYIKAGGYKALKAARKMDRGELIVTIEETSRLRGRGGAAFPTGKKWSSAFKNDSEVKYIVCNADEGEPGTYKDRVIMEGDPHTVIEGILIGAYAVGAKECFIYVRGEYENSIRLLRNAVKQAEDKGLCGDTVIRVVSGAGAYVCGEGTAIVNSLEGVRGEPRLKPPSMAVAGLHKKPTIVNNVETFAVIPEIITKGADWFGAIGSEKYPGTKLMCMSGDVQNKVCVEVPTNATLRDVVEGFGGGVANGKKLKAIQLGGSSCGFVTPEQLDTPIDFDSIRAIGASLGSGAVYVIDETRNIVDILAEIAKFYRHESCGKCSPCREGTMRIAEILEKFAAGEGSMADIELIKSMDSYMKMSCFCPLGQSATTAFMSALKLFPEDFAAKLRKEA